MVVPIASSFSSPNPRSARSSAPLHKPHLLVFPNRPRKASPLVLWHLLSFDAPTVAALWTWSLASSNGIHLPWTSIAAMAIAVWLLYAGDRLLDARALTSAPNDALDLEERHRFHHRHRRSFLSGIVVASLALAAILPTLHPEAIHLYLIEGSFLAGYFLIIHAVPHAHRVPKEFAVGLFFAAATFIPTIARQPGLRVPLLTPAFLYAALCTLNCLFIYSWEHPSRPSKEISATAHVATRIALKHLRALAAALLLASVTLLLTDASVPWRIPAAIALSTILLVILHQYRQSLHPTTIRAAADLALLTPVLFLFH